MPSDHLTHVRRRRVDNVTNDVSIDSTKTPNTGQDDDGLSQTPSLLSWLSPSQREQRSSSPASNITVNTATMRYKDNMNNNNGHQCHNENTLQTRARNEIAAHDITHTPPRSRQDSGSTRTSYGRLSSTHTPFSQVASQQLLFDNVLGARCADTSGSNFDESTTSRSIDNMHTDDDSSKLMKRFGSNNVQQQLQHISSFSAPPPAAVTEAMMLFSSEEDIMTMPTTVRRPTQRRLSCQLRNEVDEAAAADVAALRCAHPPTVTRPVSLRPGYTLPSPQTPLWSGLMPRSSDSENESNGDDRSERRACRSSSCADELWVSDEAAQNGINNISTMGTTATTTTENDTDEGASTADWRGDIGRGSLMHVGRISSRAEGCDVSQHDVAASFVANRTRLSDAARQSVAAAPSSPAMLRGSVHLVHSDIHGSPYGAEYDSNNTATALVGSATPSCLSNTNEGQHARIHINHANVHMSMNSQVDIDATQRSQVDGSGLHNTQDAIVVGSQEVMLLSQEQVRMRHEPLPRSRLKSNTTTTTTTSAHTHTNRTSASRCVVAPGVKSSAAQRWASEMRRFFARIDERVLLTITPNKYHLQQQKLQQQQHAGGVVVGAPLSRTTPRPSCSEGVVGQGRRTAGMQHSHTQDDSDAFTRLITRVKADVQRAAVSPRV